MRSGDVYQRERTRNVRIREHSVLCTDAPANRNGVRARRWLIPHPELGYIHRDVRIDRHRHEVTILMVSNAIKLNVPDHHHWLAIAARVHAYQRCVGPG